MALFIAVRQHQQNNNPWIAMLTDRTLEGLRSQTHYDSTETRSLPRSATDRKVGTQSYIDNNTGNNTTLILFELTGAVSKRAGFR